MMSVYKTLAPAGLLSCFCLERRMDTGSTLVKINTVVAAPSWIQFDVNCPWQT